MSHRKLVSLVIAVALAAALGCGVWNSNAVWAATDLGRRDFSFSTGGVSEPTGEHQSKLWFNDGIWWGSLFDRSSEEYHIYRYDEGSQTWSDTGTLIDERNNSKADVLWDGTRLHVVSAGSSETGAGSARILRYSYDPATETYSGDPGFPFTVSDGGMKVITIAKDTMGRLWVTYVQGGRVFVNHSLGDGLTWAGPSELPVPGTVATPDDISSVISFGSRIGVMWSNQAEDAMYFATHDDGDPGNDWRSEAAIQGPDLADDHISLKTDSSGSVFAVTKTSLNDPPNTDRAAPLTLLLVRSPDGGWSRHTVGRVSEHFTRARAQIDEQNRELYVFMTSGGRIHYKRASLDNISFSEGRGTPLIQSGTDKIINNATSTKQNLNTTTGLLIMASDKRSGFYWHNTIDLDNGTPPQDTQAPETTITSGPSGTVNSSTVAFEFSSSEAGSDFECSFDGAAFSGCFSPQRYTALADGPHTFQVRATDAAGNTDLTPASRSWTVDTSIGGAPVVQAPEENLVNLSKLGVSSIPVELTWSATDDDGIASYQLQQNTNGGPYTDISLASATSTSVKLRLSPGNTYQFRLRATDSASNTSEWVSAEPFVVEDYQEDDAAITYAGIWIQQTLSSAYGGGLRFSEGASAESATFAFTGSEVAWVAPKGSDRGKAEVYLDGAKVDTVDLYSSSNKARLAVFADSVPPGSHMLEVRTLGSKRSASSGRRIDVDGFFIVR